VSASPLATEIAYRVGHLFTLASRFIAFMFIGVAFNYHYRHRLRPIELGVIAVALALVFCVTWKIQRSVAPATTPEFSSTMIGSYALALAVFSASYLLARFWPPNRLLTFFADVSYPLYVVHGIAGYVALGIMVAQGIAPVAAFLLALSGALAISWLLHIAIELPTHRLGQRLARMACDGELEQRAAAVRL
jgi:peptidoglycan/LPS O-acetylase OafA/YrhL